MNIQRFPLIKSQFRNVKISNSSMLSSKSVQPQNISRSKSDIMRKNNLNSTYFSTTSKLFKHKKLSNYFFNLGDDSKNNNEEMNRHSHSLLKKLGVWDKEHLSNLNEKMKNPLFDSFQEDYDTDRHGSKIQSKESTNSSSFIKLNLGNIKLFNHKNNIINALSLNSNTNKHTGHSPFNFEIFDNNNKSIPEIKNHIINDEQEAEDKQNIVIQDYSRQLKKEQIKIEKMNKEKLMKVFQNIIIHKMKKKKYENILDDTYHLLDDAKTEYYLCTDILKERLKSVQKYYEAFTIGSHISQVDGVSSQKDNPNYRNKRYTRKISFAKQDSTSEDDNGKKNQENQEEKEIEIKKRQKKKTNAEIYEEKIKKYREYLSIVEDINKEIAQYDKKFENIKDDLNVIINANKDTLYKINCKILNLKKTFDNLIQEQRNYYLEILKLGIDSRNEGLTWVIKRLLELNVSLDEQDFPLFLTKHQIHYLLNISNLGFESSQLELILTSLKARQQEALEKKNIDPSKFSLNLKLFSLLKGNEKNNYKHNKIPSSVLSKESIEKLEILYQKHEDFMKHILEKKIEENNIISSVNSMKKKISEYFIEKKTYVFDDVENDEIKFLMEHEKQKEYYEDILIIKERIDELNKLILVEMKKEALNFMEKSNYFKKLYSERTNEKYEKIYAALFGTKIFL